MIWENNPDIAHIVCDNQRRVIRKLLDDHREERRPYVFCTNTMRTIEKLNRILVPVTKRVASLKGNNLQSLRKSLLSRMFFVA